jgi:hypothetical protein
MLGISKYLQKISAIILTTFGVILLPAQVHILFGSWYLTIVTAILVYLCFGLASIFYFFPGPAHRAFGIKRYPTPGVITVKLQKVDIDDNYSAVVRCSSTLLFLADPQKGDLIDKIDVLPHKEIDESLYASDDSTVDDIVRADKSHVAIYWRPKEKIHALIPYQHNMSYISSDRWGDDAFYHANYIDREIGRFQAEYVTKLPIEEVFAFIMPVLAGRITASRLYRYGFSRRRRGCQQPTIDSSQHTIHWNLDRPVKGRIYVLFAIYQAKRGDTLEWFREHSITVKLANAIRGTFKFLTSYV